MSNDYISTGKAARRLGIHQDTVRKLFREKVLDGYRITTNVHAGTYRIMIAVQSIEHFVKRQNIEK